MNHRYILDTRLEHLTNMLAKKINGIIYFRELHLKQSRGGEPLKIFLNIWTYQPNGMGDTLFRSFCKQTVLGKITAPTKMSMSYDYITLHGKKDFASVIKLRA